MLLIILPHPGSRLQRLGICPKSRSVVLGIVVYGRCAPDPDNDQGKDHRDTNKKQLRILVIHF